MAEIHVNGLAPDRSTGNRALVKASSISSPYSVAGRIQTSDDTTIHTVTFDHVIDRINFWFDGTTYMWISWESAMASTGVFLARTYHSLPVRCKTMYFKAYDSTATNLFYLATYRLLEK